MPFPWLATALILHSHVAVAQAPGACSLLSPQEITATAAHAAGKLSPDAPVRLTPKEVPGLPSALQMDQCVGEVRASGAVAARINLITAGRDLSAAEWQRAEKALEDPKDARTGAAPQKIADAQCFQHTWTTRRTVHEVTCFRTLGPHHVSVGFEHEDRAKLPPAAKVAELLGKAVARLPRR